MKKRVRLAITDANPRMPQMLLEYVAPRYHFELADNRADFVLHSLKGYDYLRTSGVRIAFTGENLVPDFNLSDYAIGSMRMSFGDRYFRLPLYRVWNKRRFKAVLGPRPDPRWVAKQKTRFCSCVVSNGMRDGYLGSLFDAISGYKGIDSGGRWRNNIGGAVRDKIEFGSTRKFALVCENSSAPGYVTEKIVDAMAANAVPIYWGAPDIAKDFNPNALIDCRRFESPGRVAERVREIDRDDALYYRMLSEPWLPGGKEPVGLSDDDIAGFLAHIFEQGVEGARRRNRVFWGQIYESRLRRAWFTSMRHGGWRVISLMRYYRRARKDEAVGRKLIEELNDRYA